MSNLVLHLETSAKVCSVALGKNGELIGALRHDVAFSHSSLLTVLIKQLLEEAGYTLKDLTAICVSAGPGSYTGLRIGTSTAKGLCYALDIPLLAVSTLECIAWGARAEKPDFDFYIPLIDARRMEVYTAIYDKSLDCVKKPHPLIVQNNPFIEYLNSGKVLFVGDGTEKCIKLLDHNSAYFEIHAKPLADHMISLAHNLLNINKFEDVAYFEPSYIKAFYTTAKKKAE